MVGSMHWISIYHASLSCMVSSVHCISIYNVLVSFMVGSVHCISIYNVLVSCMVGSLQWIAICHMLMSSMVGIVQYLASYLQFSCQMFALNSPFAAPWFWVSFSIWHVCYVSAIPTFSFSSFSLSVLREGSYCFRRYFCVTYKFTWCFFFMVITVSPLETDYTLSDSVTWWYGDPVYSKWQQKK